jgi:hypothetical protein
MKEATSSPSERLTSLGGTGVMMAGGHPWIFGAIAGGSGLDSKKREEIMGLFDKKQAALVCTHRAAL